jgi:phage-related protein
MAIFPVLKTQAVTQYPATKRVAYRNQAVRFLDGTEQRYRDSAGPLHSWVVRLNDLDETEMAALEEFVQDNNGRFGSFSFTDPWDGTVYANCSLAADGAAFTLLGEMRGRTTVTVVENRA